MSQQQTNQTFVVCSQLGVGKKTTLVLQFEI